VDGKRVLDFGELNLQGVSGDLQVVWFDARNGGGLQDGSVATVSGGSTQFLGIPPNNAGQDWLIVVTGGDPQPQTQEIFVPLDDAYVEGTTGLNNNVIKIQ